MRKGYLLKELQQTLTKGLEEITIITETTTVFMPLAGTGLGFLGALLCMRVTKTFLALFAIVQRMSAMGDIDAFPNFHEARGTWNLDNINWVDSKEELRHKCFFGTLTCKILARNQFVRIHFKELDWKWLDADMYKDVVDGEKINVEIMFGTSTAEVVVSRPYTREFRFGLKSFVACHQSWQILLLELLQLLLLASSSDSAAMCFWQINASAFSIPETFSINSLRSLPDRSPPTAFFKFVSCALMCPRHASSDGPIRRLKQWLKKTSRPSLSSLPLPPKIIARLGW
jgi:hypothetical protein